MCEASLRAYERMMRENKCTRAEGEIEPQLWAFTPTLLHLPEEEINRAKWREMCEATQEIRKNMKPLMSAVVTFILKAAIFL